MKDGTVSFWGEDNLPVSTKLHYSNFPTYLIGPQKKTIFSGAFAAFHLMFS